MLSVEQPLILPLLVLQFENLRSLLSINLEFVFFFFHIVLLILIPYQILILFIVGFCNNNPGPENLFRGTMFRGFKLAGYIISAIFTSVNYGLHWRATAGPDDEYQRAARYIRGREQFPRLADAGVPAMTEELRAVT